MKVAVNTDSQGQWPFKAECYGFGPCWDVACSDIKIGHKVVFHHLKKTRFLRLIYGKKIKKRKKRNQYLDVSATCRASVSVKLLVMSSHQWAELNPKSTGGGAKVADQFETPAPDEPSDKDNSMRFFLLCFRETKQTLILAHALYPCPNLLLPLVLHRQANADIFSSTEGALCQVLKPL